MSDLDFHINANTVVVTVQGAALRRVAQRMQASGLLENDGIYLLPKKSDTVLLILRPGVDPADAAARLAMEAGH